MKKLIYLILISFCLFSPLQAQDVILPFSKILSWLDADSIHCRVFYADSVIAGVVITNYSYLSADSIITASFTVWDTTTGFKFVDFQGVQRKAFIDSLGVRELTVTDSAYIDTLTIEVLKVLGKAIIDDSLRNNGTFRQFLTATFGATATDVQISSTGNITMNTTIADQEAPTFQIGADFDTDASATTGYTLTLDRTGNATPTSGYWTLTSSGGLGIQLPKVGVNTAPSASYSFMSGSAQFTSNIDLSGNNITTIGALTGTGGKIYTLSNFGIGTTAPVKKLHVKGDVAIGDTATATNERFLYFAGDGNTTQHKIKHINTGTGFSGFYFSDSISADGYIDYCEYYEGNALNAVASVEKELGSSSKQGFAKLNHNSLPTGVRTTFDLSYWKRKSDNLRMHDGFKPVMSIDPVWIVTPDTSYWQQPTDEDKINYVGNFDLVKEPKPGRNISRMVSLLTKAVQELQTENTLLKKRLDTLEKP